MASTSRNCVEQILMDNADNEEESNNLNDDNDDDLEFVSAVGTSSKRRRTIQPDISIQPKRPNELNNRIDKICEFAQVLMHCLLFKINYYNKKSHFDKYIKYNMIVYVRLFFYRYLC